MPPIKGKVSETSLDKDGWIKGGRLVFEPSDTSQLEFVVGDLDPNEEHGVGGWEGLSYLEFELTQNWSGDWRTELGVFDFNDGVILRVELHHH